MELQEFKFPSQLASSRRLKRFAVTPNLMLSIATEGWDGSGVRCIAGIPAGATLLKMEIAMPWGDLVFTVTHSSFEEVEFGKQPPLVKVRHERTHRLPEAEVVDGE